MTNDALFKFITRMIILFVVLVVVVEKRSNVNVNSIRTFFCVVGFRENNEDGGLGEESVVRGQKSLLEVQNILGCVFDGEIDDQSVVVT